MWIFWSMIAKSSGSTYFVHVLCSVITVFFILQFTLRVLNSLEENSRLDGNLFLFPISFLDRSHPPRSSFIFLGRGGVWFISSYSPWWYHCLYEWHCIILSFFHFFFSFRMGHRMGFICLLLLTLVVPLLARVALQHLLVPLATSATVAIGVLLVLKMTRVPRQVVRLQNTNTFWTCILLSKNKSRSTN